MTHTLRELEWQVLVVREGASCFGHEKECGHEAGGRVGLVAHIS